MAKKRASGGSVDTDKKSREAEKNAEMDSEVGDSYKLNTPIEYTANKPDDLPDAQLNTPVDYQLNPLNDSVVKKSGGRVKTKKFNRGGKAKKEIKAEGGKAHMHMGKPARKSKH